MNESQALPEPTPTPNPKTAHSTESRIRTGLHWLLLLALLLVGCKTDQVTKAWASESIQGEPMTVVPKLLEFRYAENPAIAFSMFHSLPEKVRVPIIYSLTSIALLALFSIIWAMRRSGFLRLLPLVLILSGAVGNIIDRLAHGYVIDFVHVHWMDTWSFPIFNVADSLITVGGTLTLLLLLFAPEPKAPDTASA